MTRSVKLIRVLFTVSILAIASVAAAANNSEQVVFSGAGTFTLGGGMVTATPFGFWIWCESDSGNGYLGNCNGAMYFTNCHITRSVIDAGPGSIVENGEGLYTLHVIDKKSNGSVIDCFLTNHSDDPGPSNLITVSCSEPFGSGSAPNSVVNVTGP